MPRDNGVNNIYVKFNGVHIPGSPFRIKVGKEDADPAAVNAHGNGLGDVKTGEWKRHIYLMYFYIFDHNKLKILLLKTVAEYSPIIVAAEWAHFVQIRYIFPNM